MVTGAAPAGAAAAVAAEIAAATPWKTEAGRLPSCVYLRLCHVHDLTSPSFRHRQFARMYVNPGSSSHEGMTPGAVARRKRRSRLCGCSASGSLGGSAQSHTEEGEMRNSRRMWDVCRLLFQSIQRYVQMKTLLNACEVKDELPANKHRWLGQRCLHAYSKRAPCSRCTPGAIFRILP